MKEKKGIFESQKIKQRKTEGIKHADSNAEDTTQSEEMRYKNADKIYE